MAEKIALDNQLNDSSLQDFARATPVLWLLVRREFKSRYAGSNLGVVWNVVHPIVLIAIYILVFSHLMKSRVGSGTTLDYGIHLTSGMIPWFFFSEVLNRNTSILIENANFLKKLAMPPEVLHLSVLVNSFLVHSFSIIALGFFLLIAGIQLPASFFFVFPIMILLGIVAMGIGMVLSVLNLVLRDIGQLVNIALQFWFWLTPIVYYYDKAILPEWIMNWLRWNPVLPYVSMIQRIFGSPGHAWEPGMGIHLMFLLPFASALIGITFLRRNQGEILDML